MTLLAPEIVEMIVDGRQPSELTLSKLMKVFPVKWKAQTKLFGTRIEIAPKQV